MKRQGRKRKLSPETMSWLHKDQGVTIVTEKVVAMGVDYIDALIEDFNKRIK